MPGVIIIIANIAIFPSTAAIVLSINMCISASPAQNKHNPKMSGANPYCALAQDSPSHKTTCGQAVLTFEAHIQGASCG